MRSTQAQRSVAVASLVVAVVLTVLTGFALVTVSSIRESQRETERLSAVVTVWRDLQLAVAEEAFAEAGYRRAPSAPSRERLDAAIAAVPERMDRARELGDARDAATLSYVSLLNDRYVSELRRTLDGSVRPGTDDRVAGPALDAMSQVLAGAVQGHRDRSADARAQQAELTGLIAWVVPAGTLVAAAALAMCWLTLVRAHRRLMVDATAHALRASQDPLTGLANRSRLRVEFEERVRQGRGCALLLVDLDRFKEVNDSLGHQAGDALLVAVGEHLSGVVRSGDVVARLGGDEFAVLLDNAGGLARVADQIVLGVADLALAYDVPVGASVGTACWPRDAAGYEDLVAAADAALYAAKRSGRGRAAHAGDTLAVVAS